MAGLNGNTKWVAGLIITFLLAILAFMGGRFSTSGAITLNRQYISENAATNKVQDEQIKALKESLGDQGKKIDAMYEILLRIDRTKGR